MPTDDDTQRLRRDLQLMFEAMGRLVDTLEDAAVAILIEAIDRMWAYACERSDAEALALELWAVPEKAWEKLPGSAQLKALYLLKLFEADGFHELISGLYDLCWDLWVRLEFNARTAAVLELQLMLEDLPSQWTKVPVRERAQLSRGLRLIQVRLEDRLRTEPDGRLQATNGHARVWRLVSERMIALCVDGRYQADVMAFSEAFVATRQLYVRVGIYAAVAAR